MFFYYFRSSEETRAEQVLLDSEALKLALSDDKSVADKQNLLSHMISQLQQLKEQLHVQQEAQEQQKQEVSLYSYFIKSQICLK